MVSWGCLGSRRRQIPVMVAVFLFFMGDTMLYMTAIPMITYGVCRHKFPNMTSDFCLDINQHPEEQYDIQKSSALLLMVERMISTLPPMALSAVMGPWSDVHGRRLPFMAPFAGCMAGTALFVLAPFGHGLVVVGLVMAGFLVRACFGQLILIHLVSGSCIVDVIDADNIVYEEIGAGRRKRKKRRRRRRRRKGMGAGEEEWEEWKGEGGSSGGGGGGGRKKEERRVSQADGSGSGSYTMLGVGSTTTTTTTASSEGEASGGRGRGSDSVGGRWDHGEYLAAMARLQVAESLGMMLGPFLGWLLQQAGGSTASFAASAATMILGMTVVVSFTRTAPGPSTRLRQDADDEDGADGDVDKADRAEAGGGLRSGRSSRNSGSLGRLVKKKVRSLRTLLSCSRRLDISPTVLWCCLLVVFVMNFCGEGRVAVTVVFVQSPPLSWPNRRISAYMAAFSAFQSAFLFFVTPFLRDRTLVGVSLACSALGGLWMCFSFTTWSMMLAGCLSQMLDCVFPALRAILARNLAQRDQIGELLSRMSVAEALGSVLGPAIVVQIFNATLDYYPGLVYLIMAAAPAAILLVDAVAEACSPGPGSASGSGSARTAARDGSNASWREEMIVPTEAVVRTELTRSLGVTRPALLMRAAE